MTAGDGPAVITRYEMTRPSFGDEKGLDKFRKRQRSLETTGEGTLKRGTKVHQDCAELMVNGKIYTWATTIA